MPSQRCKELCRRFKSFRRVRSYHAFVKHPNKSQERDPTKNPKDHQHKICVSHMWTSVDYTMHFGLVQVMHTGFVEDMPCNLWLVIYLPLWKIWKSVGCVIPNVWKNKVTFQATNQLCCSYPCTPHHAGMNLRSHFHARSTCLYPINQYGSLALWYGQSYLKLTRG